MILQAEYERVCGERDDLLRENQRLKEDKFIVDAQLGSVIAEREQLTVELDKCRKELAACQLGWA